MGIMKEFVEFVSRYRTSKKIRRTYQLMNKEYEGSRIPIRITRGTYKNVVFCVHTVEFGTEPINGLMPLKFAFDVIDHNGIQGLNDENMEFVNTIGDIIVDLIVRRDVQTF